MLRSGSDFKELIERVRKLIEIPIHEVNSKSGCSFHNPSQPQWKVKVQTMCLGIVLSQYERHMRSAKGRVETWPAWQWTSLQCHPKHHDSTRHFQELVQEYAWCSWERWKSQSKEKNRTKSLQWLIQLTQICIPIRAPRANLHRYKTRRS